MRIIKRVLILIKRNINAYKLGLPVFLGIRKFKMPNKIFWKGQQHDLFFPLDDATAKGVFIETFLDHRYKFENIKKAKTIIDIGANCGLTTLFLNLQFQDATVHAFEPNPELIYFIKKNTQNKNTIIHNKALGNKESKIKLLFTSRKDKIVSGLTRALEDEEGVIEQVDFAKFIKLQDKPIDLVKMDCEGGEWNLLGLSEWQKVKVLSMEYHLAPIEGKDFNALKILIDRNFNIIKHVPLEQTTGFLFCINKEYENIYSNPHI